MKKNESSRLVSVIIPAYNAEKCIGEAIESILNQTYRNLEIIIIDDASTDDTWKIIKQYQAKDERILAFHNKYNLGIGKNRALGVKLASGDYICWQDADDISLQKRVTLQAEYLVNHKEVGVVGGFIQFFDEDGDGVVRRYYEFDSELRSKMFRYNPVAQPASMFRSEVYKTVGSYDCAYVVSEDLEMLFRTGTKYHFANVQETILKYRQTASSLTRSNLRKMEKVTLDLRKLYSNNPAYNFNTMDWLYNWAQRISMALPVGLRMFIFRIIRGDK